jgi:hypothetical protein
MGTALFRISHVGITGWKKHDSGDGEDSAFTGPQKEHHSIRELFVWKKI